MTGWIAEGRLYPDQPVAGAGGYTAWGTPAPAADRRVREDAIWSQTFDAYHRSAYTIEGAMARADDAVRRWRAGEPA